MLCHVGFLCINLWTTEPWTACVEFCGTRSVLAWGGCLSTSFNHVCCEALCPHSQLWGTTYWYCKYWHPVVTIFVVSYCPSLVDEAILIETFVGVHKMFISHYTIGKIIYYQDDISARKVPKIKNLVTYVQLHNNKPSCKQNNVRFKH